MTINVRKILDTTKCNDFDKFENTIIDKKLKSVYLKDIIHIMKSHNPELFNNNVRVCAF